jgi:hypothetical protein
MYVMATPPRSPVMLAYGDSFPSFLRRIGQGSAVEYLADIAELESARTRAYHAEDATPVGLDEFMRLPMHWLAELRLRLHPSVTLLTSRFPVVSIWESNLYANDNAFEQWRPESALIARPDLDVEVHRLSAGAYEFFTALQQERTVGDASASAMAKDPRFDLTACLSTLIASRIVVGFELSRASSYLTTH